MESEEITAAVSNNAALEPIADALQGAVSKAYGAAGSPGRTVANLLHGVWLGHPLHPALTDIPVGTWTAVAVLDVIEAAGGRSDLGPGSGCRPGSRPCRRARLCRVRAH